VRGGGRGHRLRFAAPAPQAFPSEQACRRRGAPTAPPPLRRAARDALRRATAWAGAPPAATSAGPRAPAACRGDVAADAARVAEDAGSAGGCPRPRRTDAGTRRATRSDRHPLPRRSSPALSATSTARRRRRRVRCAAAWRGHPRGFAALARRVSTPSERAGAEAPPGRPRRAAGPRAVHAQRRGRVPPPTPHRRSHAHDPATSSRAAGGGALSPAGGGAPSGARGAACGAGGARAVVPSPCASV